MRSFWTPEQNARIEEIIEQGIPSSQWVSYLNGEKSKDAIHSRIRRVRNAAALKAPISDPQTPASQTSASSASGLDKDERKQLQEMRDLVETQQSEIERLRKPRIRLSPWQPDLSKGGWYKRVLIPDTHGCKIHEGAFRAFLHDLEMLKPAEVICMGDHLDCDGYLAGHHTWGHIVEHNYSFAEDVDAANTFLDSVQSSAPGARVMYIEGNHEQRIEKQIITEVMRHGKGNVKDIEFRMRRESCQSVLSLEKRGIEFFKRSETHMGLQHPGCIKLGHCYFTHGESIAKICTKQMLQAYGGNVVFVHTHRVQMYQDATVDSASIAAWNIGFLGHKQPVWANTRVTGWQHAYGLQLVRPDGTFLHITVPIFDGESLLAELLL